MNPRALAAEFVGTFALIFIGAGSICVDSWSGGKVGLVGIALAHGLTIAVMVSATGLISGGHLNPAVTFGALLARKIRLGPAIGYALAQMAGAVLGALLLVPVFHENVRAAVSLGTPDLAPGVGSRSGIGVEAVLTFLLVSVVFGTGVSEKFAFRIGGLAIGLTVTLDILMGGPLTGAAMNPARWFGPAVVHGHFANAAVYWVGPLLGGGLAGVLWGNFLLSERKA